MAYTPEQQIRIDAANEKVANAQTAYDSAVSSKNDSYNQLKSLFNSSISNKDCYSVVSGGTADAQIAWGTANLGSCKKKLNGNLKCPNCPHDVSAFNGEYANYKTRIDAIGQKEGELNTAKAELDTLLTNIGTEVANDPQNQLDLATTTAEAEAQGKTLKTKWLIFGILAVVLIIGIGFFYFKVIKK